MKRAQPLRVLFIEDRPDDTELLLLELRRAGYLVEWERVDSRAAMADALDRGGWEAIISDYRLPGFSGPAVLALCQERALDLPFIIVSGTVQEEDAVGALKAGAHDFVSKANLARLAPAISRELRDAVERRRRRLAEQALQAAERQYRQLVESVRAVVWRCQAETLQITFVNAEAELILGYPRRQWLEAGFWEQRHHPEDLALATEARREALRHGGGQLEYRMRAADGHVIWFQEFLSTIAGRGGAAELAGVAVDVSERKKLEEQLQRGQRLEALGRLAGGIAHDFNNVVGVIIGYADLALRDLAGGHPARPRVVQMQAAADRAAKLTRQLLAFSRRQSLQPRAMELNQVVDGLREMLQRVIGEDVEMRLGLKAELWPVCADPGQLEQVLLNLVLNARDAMPHGGLLAIETANVEVDEVYVRSHGLGQPGDHVVLSVSDTGHGMDAETQRHIFEPFFTTKGPGEGTGLGLSVVYGIIEQSGGHVSVYSEPGHGTTFKVYLPRDRVEVEPVPRAEDQRAAARGDETILLVEDETTLRCLIAELLASAGYRVLEARQGAEATRLADAHPGRIHLLVTDVVMPGANGREVVRMILARRPDTRFLYISGHPRDVFDHQGSLAPGHVLLQKPFTADTLLRTVRDVLDAGAAPPEPA